VVEAGKNSFANVVAKARELSPTRAGMKQALSNAAAKVRELSPTRAGMKQSLSNAAAKVRELSPTRTGMKQSLSNVVAKAKDRLSPHSQPTPQAGNNGSNSPQRNLSTTSDGLPNVSRNNSSMQNANKLVNNLPVGQGVANQTRNADANVFLPNDTSVVDDSTTSQFSPQHPVDLESRVGTLEEQVARLGTLEEQVAQIMQKLNSRS
jgi:hypothetical protein